MATYSINEGNWNNGLGLNQYRKTAQPGDVIEFAAGDYYQNTKVYWDTSGTADNPIIIRGAGNAAKSGEMGTSVISAKEKWPRLYGGTENTILSFAENVSNIVFERFQFRNLERAFFAGGALDNITLRDIFLSRVSELIRMGSATLPCAGLAIQRVYARGLGKGILRATNLKNAVIEDCYGDTYTEDGFRVVNWNLIFQYSEGCERIRHNRVFGANAYQPQALYDNGDLISGEVGTSEISAYDSIAYRCADSFIDTKGTNNYLENCQGIEIGNRSTRWWGTGNRILNFKSKKLDRFQTKGPSSHVWVQAGADVTIENLIHDLELYHEKIAEYNGITTPGVINWVPEPDDLPADTITQELATPIHQQSDEPDPPAIPDPPAPTEAPPVVEEKPWEVVDEDWTEWRTPIPEPVDAPLGSPATVTSPSTDYTSHVATLGTIRIDYNLKGLTALPTDWSKGDRDISFHPEGVLLQEDDYYISYLESPRFSFPDGSAMVSRWQGESMSSQIASEQGDPSLATTSDKSAWANDESGLTGTSRKPFAMIVERDGNTIFRTYYSGPNLDKYRVDSFELDEATFDDWRGYFDASHESILVESLEVY